ncbi:cell division protein FtsA [Wolbachia endosymbiont of Pentidionis agamae]|uniref:cell division protein FtsA n=1 Tax=Wolbachia endosymbiont of Pentidionis agamae TaxID=3110435 RepID=UPI002FD34744
MYSAVVVKPKGNIFAVLDIATTKVACFVVKVGSSTDYKVIGIGYKAAEGISGGLITNIKRASYSISSTIELAEQVSEETISQVYVNVSGCSLNSFNVFNEIISANHEISDRDIKRVVFQTYEKYIEDNVIIHNIPLKYHLDDMNDIKNVSGLHGSRLAADVHVVTASRSALLNIENCITSYSGVSMAGCIASSYSSALSCLSDDEKDLGTVIIDIGGGYTSIGIFKKGKFIYANSIPIGGIHITRDIAHGLCTNMENAERIKILYGNTILTSVDEDKPIVVPGDESIQVPRSEFVNIVRSRIEELFELVKEKLDKKNDLSNKVVITGGGSLLTSIKEVASYILGRQVRIGCPVQVNGVDGEYNRNPVFSSAIGSIELIIDTFYRNSNNTIKKGNKISKLFNWVQSKL